MSLVSDLSSLQCINIKDSPPSREAWRCSPRMNTVITLVSCQLGVPPSETWSISMGDIGSTRLGECYHADVVYLNPLIWNKERSTEFSLHKQHERVQMCEIWRGVYRHELQPCQSCNGCGFVKSPVPVSGYVQENARAIFVSSVNEYDSLPYQR